ncbi:ATP-binding protein [Paracoccus versutus]|uniref:ATP-binding protein n=1 Tax=Paracoccus versutus TaxID=34007 RepID=UPI000DF82431|nr:PAS domain-containing hybrid sensor histidine kinase/response regulator [Paracoccus versutus]RDD70847.1 PAS domain-containing sensor histidine kinase [Paracoccus versutus]
MADESVNMSAFAVLRPDGVVSYCSPPFAHLLGSEERLVGGTPVDAWLRPVEGAASGWFASVQRSEGHLLRTDGAGQFCYRLDPMAGGGAILYVMQKMGNLDPIYARAFQINPGLSALSVLDTGEHLDVNDAWLRNMEYSRDEVIGRTASEMQVWEQGDTSRAEIVRRLREEGKIENFQARMRTRTGKLRDILVSAELVEHEGRKLAFFASHDITEVRKAQGELEALNRQLEQRIAERTAEIERKNQELAEAAERAQAANEAKSQFLSVMSHEIRTPLNALLNMAELLIEDGSPAPAGAYLTGIASSARALSAIVNDVLDFSRIETGHLEIYPNVTDIGQLCEEAVRGIATLAHRKGLDVALIFGPRLPKAVTVDPVRLRQILFNLVGNAIKYTQQGWIEVRADLAGGDEESRLVVEVADTGIGIRPEDLGRIFERFSRIGADANREIHGAGLGLNISAGLARAMGGMIDVESEFGRGSSFRVTLPLAPRDDAAETSLRQPLQGCVALLGPAGRTREAFRVTLKGQGLDVCVFDTAEAAGAASPLGVDTALIVLPVDPDGADGSAGAGPSDWPAAARGLSDRVVVLVPLGSTVARSLAEASGLRVEVYPIAPPNLLAIIQGGTACDPRPAQEKALSLAGVRVLVADDGEENRLVAQWVLSASGAEVVTVESGQSAIDCAVRQPFDILLLDLRMPDFSGYETALRIRALGGWAARVPIVAVSANIAPDMTGMRAAGIDGFLAKPFTPAELRAKVQGHLHHPGDDIGPENSNMAAATPVLDENFLASQVTYAGPDAVGKAISGFLGNLDDRLSRIQSGADVRERADAAHALAGAAGALALLDLAAHCRRLASDTDDRPRATPGPDRDALASSAERAVAALREAWSKLMTPEERGGSA